MTHLALDLGLRCTGVAWHDGSDTHVCPSGLKGGERLEWWYQTFRHLFLPFDAGDTVVVESPFIHVRNINGAMELIKLHGVCELAAEDAVLTYVSVTPTELKKWATGQGGANKHMMCEHAKAMGFDGTDHNEADAYLLWHMHQERATA